MPAGGDCVGGRGETERTESKSTLREMNLNVFSQMMNQNPGESMTNLCSPNVCHSIDRRLTVL